MGGQIVGVAGVAGDDQRAVEVADVLGRFDIDWVLIAEGPLLYSENEAKLFDVLGQVGESEANSLALFSVEHLKKFLILHPVSSNTFPLPEDISDLMGSYAPFPLGNALCGDRSIFPQMYGKPAFE